MPRDGKTRLSNMEFSLPIKIKRILKGIALYQIAGGIIGFMVIGWIIANTHDFSITQILTLPFAICLFGFSIFCGQRILKGEINKALKLSTINQSLQLLNFSVFGFVFKYTAGLYVAIGFDYTNVFIFVLNFGPSEFILNIDSSYDQILLQMNLVSIFILSTIIKLKKVVEVELALFNSVLPYDNSGNLLRSLEDIQLDDNYVD